MKKTRKKVEKFQTPPNIMPLNMIDLIQRDKDREEQERKQRNKKYYKPPLVSQKSFWFPAYRIWGSLYRIGEEIIKIVVILFQQVKKHTYDRFKKNPDLFVVLFAALFYTKFTGLNEHWILALAILLCTYFTYQLFFTAVREMVDIDIQKRKADLTQVASMTFKGISRHKQIREQIKQLIVEAREVDRKYRELLENRYDQNKNFAAASLIELSANEIEKRAMLDRYISFEDRFAETLDFHEEFRKVLSNLPPENQDGRIEAERAALIARMTRENKLGLNPDRDLPYKHEEESYDLSDLYNGYYKGHNEHYLIMDDILENIESDENGKYIFPPIYKNREKNLTLQKQQ